jgi:tripartite ATP-independent transporter DctM subunit
VAEAVVSELTPPSGEEPGGGPLAGVARVTGAVSWAIATIAATGIVLAGVALVGAIAANIVRREVTGESIYGAYEFARFAFLWIIWLGVSLAVRRGAVTVITLFTERGPWWWRASLHGLAGGALAVLLVYACYRSYDYATAPVATDSVSAALRWPMWIPISSMMVGYFFITTHYFHALVVATNRVIRTGPSAYRTVAAGAAGGAVLALILWAVTYGLLQAGVASLIPLAIIFVALTLAGMPIVFMLSFVGILGAAAILGLTFFPFGSNDPLFPFRTTQTAMGLSAGGELLVIFEFLLVAELMNTTGLSARLIRLAASLVGHFRGGMAYVCQLTSAMLSGISGSAQADAAVMTPLLVPAMEREGYRKDVAAAVVAGSSIKGPVGPISIMYIAYGFIVSGIGAAAIDQMLITGVVLVVYLLVLQGLVVSWVVRRIGMESPHGFLGWAEVWRSFLAGGPVLLIPIVILGGILKGTFTPTEAAAVAVIVTLVLGACYGKLPPRALLRGLVLAGVETGVVMLLLGDSAILAKLLEVDGFGLSLQEWITGVTSNPHVFLLIVIGLLLAVGMFVEPLPALFILAPFLAPVAVGVYGIDPVQFAVVVVMALVLGLIHPPVGLVLFLVSSIAKVSFERLSLTMVPWLAISLVLLILVAMLPAEFILWLANWTS